VDLRPTGHPVDHDHVDREAATAAGPTLPRGVARPTRRVVALMALLLLAGSALLAAVVADPPQPSTGLRVPWWVLALLFAATEIWVFHIQFGREAKSISLSEIPLVIGLFYAAPLPLVVARVVGPAAVVVLHRRQTPLKAALNATLFFANGAVALAVYRVLSGGSVSDGPREWVAAVVAAAVAIVVDLVVLGRILSWYGGRTGPSEALRGSASGVVMAVAAAVIGIIAVLTLRLGALATLPLVAAGVVLMVGYRSYSSLADRHTSLERLFRFSRELTGAPATTDVLPAVLEQARQLLRAEVAEVIRFRSGPTSAPGTGLWRYDGSRVTTDSGEAISLARTLVQALVRDGEAVRLTHSVATQSAFLRSRAAREAVVAPLIVEGDAVGVLAVYDRLGEVRGFLDSDVRLLQTVANHASVALHNEMLIGRLRHDALHDALTGLPNRSHLTALATSAVARATAGRSRVAMMIIDLNGFKVVNDTLGHHVGDQLIGEVGARLAAAAGPGVTVARLGGDEFAVLVEPVAGDGADIARRMVEAVGEPVTVGEDRLHLSGSVGIALAPDHATAVSDLLKRADIAMYAAKNGPDAVVVYRQDIDLNDPSLLSLMGELREALVNGQIGIEVEPVLDLLGNRLVAAEALVRWHHPTRGTLRPDTFLPLAERNGLIVPLTELVLERAVAACADWCGRGLEIGISVNLSARSLLDRTLPGSVAEVLRRHRLPAHLLTLEITESIVISDADRALGLLTELRALGVRLALDDFGTGYSSLTYLSALPIQQLKIDRSFVTRIVDSSRDAAIVTSLVDLAHHLGLEVIAEGVEGTAVRDRLRRLGCEYGQGYLFATSMAPEDLPGWAATAQPLDAGSLRGQVDALIP
jgi:diguanylate cyclase (GGDEF)-like protein